MTIKTVLMAAAAGCCVLAKGAEGIATASSPDGRNQIRLYSEPLAYEVFRDGKVLVAHSEIGMTVNGARLAEKGAAPKVTTGKVTGVENTPVYKKGKVNLERNEAFADFGQWGVRLAARNDGVAYRFETKLPGRIRVDGETASVVVPDASAKCRVNFTDAYGCEETVAETREAKDVVTGGKGKRLAYLPLVYSVSGKTVAITESDVSDYPIWNLERPDAAAVPVLFKPAFAGWPKRTERVGGWGSKPEEHGLKEGGRWLKVLEHDGYLVETDGTRPFPWRTFVLADEPAKLCEADIVYALARPAASGGDFSWVKPGKVAWDWWNDWFLEDVPFKAGCNTKSYEYYIDFAAKTGVEYVIFDEGWSEALNIWKFHPDVDVPQLIDYANKKGVGIILWLAWAQAYGNEDKVAAHFAKLGAKGFKVDFMDRGDAEVERFLWTFADACARNRMLVDYHGAHRPTGMSRAYPNVLNYEGIHGLEQMKFYKGQDILGNDVRCFFGRLTAGPMDYTPGAMLNYPVGKYTGDWKHPGSMGTRCRQMAMMTLYEAPLQMLCDSPTRYEKNQECFRFMAATPVVWDDTVGLGGSPETFAAVARRKGAVWYAAGISSAEARDFELDTGFLGAGSWSAEIFRDAPGSEAEPTKYVRETRSVQAGDRIKFRMAPGGGFAVRLAKRAADDSAANIGDVRLKGYLGARLDAMIERHVIGTDVDYITAPFLEKTETKGWWQSEFWGKYMHSAMPYLQYTGSAKLKGNIDRGVARMLASQEACGYIGNYPDELRCGEGWDVWGMKYTMMGLMHYYDVTKSPEVLEACKRVCDYVIAELGPGGKRGKHLYQTGNWSGYASSSILEPVMWLHKRTQDKKYLDFATYLVKDMTEAEDGPRLLDLALKGVSVADRNGYGNKPEAHGGYVMKHNRWKAYEMMSCYQGMLEYFEVTGRKDLFDAAVATGNDIIKEEINLAGGCACSEAWFHGARKQHLPYMHLQETCVTTTWMRFCEKLLDLTGDPKWADEIERTFYNVYLGAMKADGAEFAGYTPLSGNRYHGQHHCYMHTDCCTANGPRGFLCFLKELFRTKDDAAVFNFYSTALVKGVIPSTGKKVAFDMYSLYPRSNAARIVSHTENAGVVPLKLRIPKWSETTVVKVNGQEQKGAVSGAYFTVEREWKLGDIVEIKFDMPVVAHTLGHNIAFTRGPVLLARDSRFGDGDFTAPFRRGIKDGQRMPGFADVRTPSDDMWMAFSATLPIGSHHENPEGALQQTVFFCDYASAGNTWHRDNYYRTWFTEEYGPTE